MAAHRHRPDSLYDDLASFRIRTPLAHGDEDCGEIMDSSDTRERSSLVLSTASASVSATVAAADDDAAVDTSTDDAIEVKGEIGYQRQKQQDLQEKHLMIINGSNANVTWRAIPMHALRKHPLYVPLPSPDVVIAEDPQDFFLFQQDSWQWNALHQGRLTSSKIAACLGFYEGSSSTFLGIPDSLSGHHKAIDAYEHLRKKAPADWSHLSATAVNRNSDSNNKEVVTIRSRNSSSNSSNKKTGIASRGGGGGGAGHSYKRTKFSSTPTAMDAGIVKVKSSMSHAAEAASDECDDHDGYDHEQNMAASAASTHWWVNKYYRSQRSIKNSTGTNAHTEGIISSSSPTFINNFPYEYYSLCANCALPIRKAMNTSSSSSSSTTNSRIESAVEKGAGLCQLEHGSTPRAVCKCSQLDVDNSSDGRVSSTGNVSNSNSHGGHSHSHSHSYSKHYSNPLKARLAWGSEQEATGILAAVNYFAAAAPVVSSSASVAYKPTTTTTTTTTTATSGAALSFTAVLPGPVAYPYVEPSWGTFEFVGTAGAGAEASTGNIGVPIGTAASFPPPSSLPYTTTAAANDTLGLGRDDKMRRTTYDCDGLGGVVAESGMCCFEAASAKATSAMRTGLSRASLSNTVKYATYATYAVINELIQSKKLPLLGASPDGIIYKQTKSCSASSSSSSTTTTATTTESLRGTAAVARQANGNKRSSKMNTAEQLHSARYEKINDLLQLGMNKLGASSACHLSNEVEMAVLEVKCRSPFITNSGGGGTGAGSTGDRMPLQVRVKPEVFSSSSPLPQRNTRDRNRIIAASNADNISGLGSAAPPLSAPAPVAAPSLLPALAAKAVTNGNTTADDVSSNPDTRSAAIDLSNDGGGGVIVGHVATKMNSQTQTLACWHVPQLQLEMLCAGPECQSAYVVLLDCDKACILRIARDDAYITEMMHFVSSFYTQFVRGPSTKKPKPPPSNFFSIYSTASTSSSSNSNSNKKRATTAPPSGSSHTLSRYGQFLRSTSAIALAATTQAQCIEAHLLPHDIQRSDENFHFFL